MKKSKYAGVAEWSSGILVRYRRGFDSCLRLHRGGVAHFGRASLLHGEGRRFNSSRFHQKAGLPKGKASAFGAEYIGSIPVPASIYSGVGQWLGHLLHTQVIVGPSPTPASRSVNKRG